MGVTEWIIICIITAIVGAGGAYFISTKKNSAIIAEKYQLLANIDNLEKSNEALRQEKIQSSEAIDTLNTELRDVSSKLSAELEKTKIISTQNAELKTQVEQLTNDNANLNRELQRVSSEYSAEAQKNKWVEAADKSMREAFGALSKEIIENNNVDFLNKANDKLNDFASKLDEKMQGENKAVANILTPVSENLTELKKHIGELEEKRTSAYAELNQTVSMLKNQNDILTNEAKNLNSALRNSSVRGKWGEAQLRRVAELSGMIGHIDFEEQYVNNDGKRPDMIIRLTGNRSIPVDSKAPMDDYLKYTETQDEAERARSLDGHVRALKKHIDALSKKEYWKSEERSVQMVALVIPYESGLSAAFEGDPSIFIYAVDRNVLLLSPITFYAFLKSVALGWSEYDLAKSANEIAQLSKELVDRFDVFLSHVTAVGTNIDKAAASYNKAIGSYNSRLNSTFNKLRSLKQLPELPMQDTVATAVNVEE